MGRRHWVHLGRSVWGSRLALVVWLSFACKVVWHWHGKKISSIVT